MPPDLKSGWVPLNSSNVRGGMYDAATQTLSVSFHNGATYEYYDVPQEVADGLFITASPGKYIKDELGGYSYSRVD